MDSLIDRFVDAWQPESMVSRGFMAALFVSCLYAGVCDCRGQTDSSASGPVRVGTKVAPPFAIKDGNGEWSGISIELWNAAATAMGVRTEFVECDLDGLLEGLRTGALDAGVSALTMTKEREVEMDFSYPYFSSGLTLAFRKEDGLAIFGLLRKFISWQFVSAVGALVFVVLSVGLLVWIAERRRNSGQFEKSAVRGIGSGF